MLAAPDAAAWAAHPAARAGKLEKRGKLKDEWKALLFPNGWPLINSSLCFC